METQLKEPERETFVETALKLGGKSEEEARTTGTVDRADDQVDALFAARYQTANSPVHRAVWDRKPPVELFLPEQPTVPPACEQAMEKSIAAVTAHRARGTLYGPDGKLSQALLDDLSIAGYWGLLIDRQYAPGSRRCTAASGPSIHSAASALPYRKSDIFPDWPAASDFRRLH
jgi:hypothetical protein